MKLVNNNWGFILQSSALISEGLTPFLMELIKQT
ncbi:hypothetical protein EV282_3699 [Fictibacillus sp. BK138]|nr:hypothetical protein EV282_3699 [Fictibacillus sp. BK138]